jgi:hypothetical protein
MRSWLFHKLFPRQRALLMYAAKIAAEGELGREYRKKFATLQRSPLDESQWVSKFVALDRDYTALEKEVAELRVENWCLKRDIRKLTS